MTLSEVALNLVCGMKRTRQKVFIHFRIPTVVVRLGTSCMSALRQPMYPDHC